MKKAVIAIALLTLLIACSQDAKLTGRKISPQVTGSASANVQESQDHKTVQTEQASQSSEAEEKTAAELLREMQAQDLESAATVAAGPKSGTFYPPITTKGTDKDALKEKTRALFEQDVYVPDVDADDKFGPRYEYK
ncbi:hypothetical protein D6825_03145 [Candidatus Woesearchaeota archaeon]|nr:MAG: hypothetical protein D6825_03145 [Candidatus Woesearchaeota archaeon]